LISDDRQVGRGADSAERAGVRAEVGENLPRLGGPHRDRAGRVDELLLFEGVVAAQQDQRELAVKDVDEGLDLPVGGRVVAGDQVLNRPDAGRVEPLRRLQRRGGVKRGVQGLEGGDRGLDVRRVAALRGVDDVVLAGVGRADELRGARTAH
jgi:hypothetical protein